MVNGAINYSCSRRNQVDHILRSINNSVIVNKRQSIDLRTVTLNKKLKTERITLTDHVSNAKNSEFSTGPRPNHKSSESITGGLLLMPLQRLKI